MSELPARRWQFKFVGGPSRKRCRRGGLPAHDRGRTSPASSKAAHPEDKGSSSRNSPQQHHTSCEDTVSNQVTTCLPPLPSAGPSSIVQPRVHGSPDILSGGPNLDSISIPTPESSQWLCDPSAFTRYYLQSPAFSLEGDTTLNIFTPSTNHTTDIFNTYESETPRLGSSFNNAWERLVTRYDEEFCVLPLTYNFDANPFRRDPETIKTSELLLHSVLTCSYKHVARDAGSFFPEAFHHWEQAMRLLAEIEEQTDFTSFEPAVLDSILILMSLDCATSADGPWPYHLQRAHKMLETMEQLHIPNTPRVKAQIGMLVWWDVTLALTRRQGCILSESTIMGQLDSTDGSNPALYNMAGCPKDLFMYMVRLGDYSREFELAFTMKYVEFDMELVLAAEKGIREWSVPQMDDSNLLTDPEEAHELDDLAQQRQDEIHCAEA
ncbi:hypothetical protein AUP68_01701 [Ilyonectria robusta]